MALNFYNEWLGLSTDGKPSSLYELLNLPLFCTDEPRIERATRAQMRKLHVLQNHPNSQRREACLRMLKEVAGARVILTGVEKKRAYDAKLAKTLGVELPPPVEVRVAPSPETPGVAGKTLEKSKQRTAVSRHTGARQALSGAEADGRVEAFADLALAHFLRYGIGEIEEQLLVAEARIHGVRKEAALEAIRQAARDAARARQREQRFLRWTLTLSGAAVALILLVFAGVQLARYRTDRQARIEITRARELTDKEQWDQARATLVAAMASYPDHSLHFELAQEENDQVQYQALLRDAQIMYERGEWTAAVENIGSARSVLPHDPQSAKVEEAMWRRAIRLGQERCREAESLTKTRRWVDAEAEIVEAEKLLKAAGVPAERFGVDPLARRNAVHAAEESDWTRLLATVGERLEAWNIEEAEKTVREVAEVHLRRGAEVQELGERVAARKRELDAVKTNMELLVAAGDYVQARSTLEASGLPQARAQPLLDRIRDAEDADVFRVAEQAMEVTRAASGKFPSATAGVCRVLLSEVVGQATRARVEDKLRAAQVSAGDPESSDLIIELTMNDGSTKTGELVRQDSVTVEVCLLTSKNPPKVADRVEKIKASNISSQVTVQGLTDDIRRGRQARTVAEIDAALEAGAPLSALDAVGRLITRYAQGSDDVVTTRAGPLSAVAREVAGLCVACYGTQKTTCAQCNAQGYIKAVVDCSYPLCRGKGSFTCPACGGSKSVRCSTCGGSGMVERTIGWSGGNIKTPILGMVDCPSCNGGTVHCSACQGGTIVCRECKGTGRVERKLVCPSCKGKREVGCPACQGSGRRAAEAAAASGAPDKADDAEETRAAPLSPASDQPRRP